MALSVIDTSATNFLSENWTQFPYLVPAPKNSNPTNAGGGGTSSSPSVTRVNSNKQLSLHEVEAPLSLWGPKWIANLTDAIGISNGVIRTQAKRKQFSL